MDGVRSCSAAVLHRLGCSKRSSECEQNESSTRIPESALLPDFVVLAATLQIEYLQLVNWYMDELFMGGVFRCQSAVVAEVSRVVVDMHRFADNAIGLAASVHAPAT